MEKLLDLETAAELLAMSKEDVNRLLVEGELPFIIMGTELQLRESDLINYLARRE